MKLKFLLFILFSSFAVTAPAAVRCEALFDGPYEITSLDLRDQREMDIRGRSASQVRQRNVEVLNRLLRYTPPLNPGRARAIELRDAQALVDLMQNHEVVGRASTSRYDPTGEIGFCFGRATFAHLMLLKMGVSRDSIMKTWVVGPMYTGSTTWGYHVSTLVFVKDNGWMSIDSNFTEPLPLQEWYNRIYRYSVDRKLRIYVTAPNRFAPNAGTYTRVQLGLDLGVATQWYKDYFINLMASIGRNSPEDYGMRRVPPTTEPGRPGEVVTPRPTAFDMIRDFFMN